MTDAPDDPGGPVDRCDARGGRVRRVLTTRIPLTREAGDGLPLVLFAAGLGTVAVGSAVGCTGVMLAFVGGGILLVAAVILATPAVAGLSGAGVGIAAVSLHPTRATSSMRSFIAAG